MAVQMLGPTPRFRAAAFVMAAWACACASAAPQERMPAAVAVEPVAAGASASAEAYALAGDVDAAAAETPDGGPLRLSLTLRAGLPACVFVIHSGARHEDPLSYTIAGVTRIVVEESPTCAAAVLFDVEADRTREPNAQALEAGRLPKPGKLAELSGSDGLGMAAVDVNFDGYLDLDFVAMMGAYAESHRYWVFEPASRHFARNAELEALRSPTFDAVAKTITEGGRYGPNHYGGGVHAYNGGKLETLSSETVYLGETPDGGPLPAGFSRYEIRYQRKGGTLRKVFEGPVRDSP